MLHSAIASARKPADCALVLYEKNGGFRRGLAYRVLSLKIGGNQVLKKIPAVAMRDETWWTKSHAESHLEAPSETHLGLN